MALRDLNKRDLWFTIDGDFLIDGAGDLKDTDDSGDRNEAIKQAIIHRVVAERNALRLYPNISAGLESFIGKAIDQDLIEGVEYALHRALTSDGSFAKNDYVIRIVELNAGYLAILIYLRLAGQEHPLVTMSWNIQSGEVTRVI